MFPKPNKYRNKKVRRNGVMFDSKLEADYYRHLQMREDAKDISELQYHPGRIKMTKALIGYEPDFCFIEDGRKVWIDTKGGIQTRDFLIKMRLWRHYGPGLIRIVARARGGGFRTVKEIMPVEAGRKAAREVV